MVLGFHIGTEPVDPATQRTQFVTQRVDVVDSRGRRRGLTDGPDRHCAIRLRRDRRRCCRHFVQRARLALRVSPIGEIAAQLQHITVARLAAPFRKRPVQRDENSVDRAEVERQAFGK